MNIMLRPTSPVRDDIDNMFRNFYDSMLTPWAAGFLRGSQKKDELVPSMDLTSDEKAYTLHVEVPGVEADDVKLTVRDNAVIISGEKKRETEDKNHHVTERVFGSFQRAISLPEDADVEGITAAHKNGVLCVTLPRKTATKERTIEITKA